jgi:uncharacterized phage infection (PIP) family protein YhgE
MEEIVMSVKRVTDIMEEITAASEEQSGGIDQVNTAVSQMDQMTQNNAALVEEAAAAAKSMEEQTEAMARSVAMFRLPNHHSSAASTLTSAHESTPETGSMAAAPAMQTRSKPAGKEPSRPKTATSPRRVKEEGWKEF